MPDRVTQDIYEALSGLAAKIEQGGEIRASLRCELKTGEVETFVFHLTTDEERTEALLAIRKILGQVH